MIVFSWFAARQKFSFFSENSWLFFKSEQLCQIFVTSFYLLFVLSSQIETIKLFKGRHSVCYLRYMAFFYTFTWDILRMSVGKIALVYWYIWKNHKSRIKCHCCSKILVAQFASVKTNNFIKQLWRNSISFCTTKWR